jgi:hypothetical protein
MYVGRRGLKAVRILYILMIVSAYLTDAMLWYFFVRAINADTLPSELEEKILTLLPPALLIYALPLIFSAAAGILALIKYQKRPQLPYRIQWLKIALIPHTVCYISLLTVAMVLLAGVSSLLAFFAWPLLPLAGFLGMFFIVLLGLWFFANYCMLVATSIPAIAAMASSRAPGFSRPLKVIFVILMFLPIVDLVTWFCVKPWLNSLEDSATCEPSPTPLPTLGDEQGGVA